MGSILDATARAISEAETAWQPYNIPAPSLVAATKSEDFDFDDVDTWGLVLPNLAPAVDPDPTLAKQHFDLLFESQVATAKSKSGLVVVCPPNSPLRAMVQELGLNVQFVDSRSSLGGG